MAHLATHFCIGIAIRILMCIFGEFQDKMFHLAYTDVDYRVFTDASDLILNGMSPYNKTTYRYSPIISYMTLPNLLIGDCCGKLIFCAFDVGIAYLIWKIISRKFVFSEEKAKLGAIIWLYNPLSIIIASRGNCDSVTAFFVILAIMYHTRYKHVVSGLILGFCVHLRLYPIIFILPMYLSAGIVVPVKDLGLLRRITTGRKEKINFAAGFASSFAGLLGIFYYLHGKEFVEASFLYHITRKDYRHNLTPMFYMQYLGANEGTISVYDNILISLLQILPTIIIPFAYYSTRDLSFCMFCVAFAFVTFGRVMTCQYFIWFASLMPLFLPAITLSVTRIKHLLFIWFMPLGFVLLHSYLVEYRGYNFFGTIWFSGILLYVANLIVLGVFTYRYGVAYNF